MELGTDASNLNHYCEGYPRRCCRETYNIKVVTNGKPDYPDMGKHGLRCHVDSGRDQTQTQDPGAHGPGTDPTWDAGRFLPDQLSSPPDWPRGGMPRKLPLQSPPNLSLGTKLAY